MTSRSNDPVKRKAARRMVGILALAGALAPVTPASAHSCAQPTEAQVGQPLTINLGVPAEESAVVGVDVAIPPEFSLDQTDPGPGWTADRDGRRIRFSGGKVPPYGCVYFILRGKVTEKGKIKFPLTTSNEDGTTSEYNSDKIGDLYGAQLVFTGVAIRSSDYVWAEEGGGKTTGRLVLLTTLVALGIGGGAALVARRRAGQDQQLEHERVRRRVRRRR